LQFLKFTKYEQDQRIVSSRITLPEDRFSEVEKALKRLGISFRNPSGR